MTLPSIIAIVIVADAVLVVGLIALFMRRGWGPLALTYPARPPAPDAVSRRFQSFRLGLFNLGFGVHVAVDESFLHLTPIRPLRWAGAAPASIPWDAIEPLHSRLPGRWRVVRVAGRRLVGPAWCLELVSPPDAATDEEERT